ncbi:hypothetical protein [Bradyrhizobium diazoefficiens]|nr:hypothetical protein [Bradyrhizobium diazoefficiens]WLA66437.1 hypothetical protein QNN01_06450 [Bradyrhizobium diazoefficiens]
MSGIIRYESLLAARTMAQRQPKKSVGCADSVESFRNPKPKPRFDKDVFCKTSAIRRLRSDFCMVTDLGGLDVIAPLLAVLMAFASIRLGGNARTCPLLLPRPEPDMTRGVAA